MKKEPYFLGNGDWFYFDEQEFRYKLTDKAPEEAVRSYEEFYNSSSFVDEDGEEWDTN